MTPTRLGIYCPGAGTGGPWRYVHSILAGLDPDEFAATLFCDLPGIYEPRPDVKVVKLDIPAPSEGRRALAATARKTDFARSALKRLAPRPARIWAGFGNEVRRFARIIRRNPIEIFHTQNTGCEESPVAAKLAGTEHILGTFHVDSTYDLHRERSGPTHRLLEMLSNRCLDAAIAVSHATKRDWVRRSHIPGGRVVTIHNAIDPEKFRRRKTRGDARRALGLPEAGPIIGGLGRLDEAKGFVYLIDAAAQLRLEFPNLVVLIAGAGPLRESLEQQSAQLGLAGVVRFLGFQSDVQALLDALDVFAMPSLCEALPFALLEAMATDLPVVGSAVGGIPEVIVPGETGFVIPARDPIRLAESIRVLLNNAELRSRFGAAGRARVIRDFHERDMVQKTLDIYRKVSRGRLLS
jgi:glycosyltransferase involved in cell wall biosynthesis